MNRLYMSSPSLVSFDTLMMSGGGAPCTHNRLTLRWFGEPTTMTLRPHLRITILAMGSQATWSSRDLSLSWKVSRML
jgi:hypothetical protein